MEFYDTQLSDEAREVLTNLINESRELKLTSFALEIAIKILKLAEIKELSDRILKPLAVNTILSNFNQN